jgi:molybdopterin molybdotransferase
VDAILGRLGATIHIRSVAIQPGKPLTVATCQPSQDQPFPPTLYFGLPGNPVSALVTFWRFVQPALRKLSGACAPWPPAFVTARTQQDLKAGGKRESYQWGRLSLVDGQYEFELAGGNHSSGNLINLAGTSGLAVVPLGETLIAAGQPVLVMLVG